MSTKWRFLQISQDPNVLKKFSIRFFNKLLLIIDICSTLLSLYCCRIININFRLRKPQQKKTEGVKSGYSCGQLTINLQVKICIFHHKKLPIVSLLRFSSTIIIIFIIDFFCFHDLSDIFLYLISS